MYCAVYIKYIVGALDIILTAPNNPPPKKKTFFLEYNQPLSSNILNLWRHNVVFSTYEYDAGDMVVKAIGASPQT